MRMKNKLRSPFNNYRGYIKLFPNGRNYMHMVHLRTGKHKLTLLSRYRMAVKLGRRLTRNEEVDHHDRDFTNDRLSNLRLLTVAQHRAKTAKENTKPLVTLVCPVCTASFERKRQAVGHKIASGKTPTCSRKCGRVVGMTNKVDVSASNLLRIRKLRERGLSDYKISPLVKLSRPKVQRVRQEYGIV